MRSPQRVLASAALVLGVGSLACSSGAGSLQPGTDGGPATLDGSPPPFTDVHTATLDGSTEPPGAQAFTGRAFTMSSTVTGARDSFNNGVTVTQSFTLVLDMDTGVAIAGGADGFGATPFQSDDGRTFRVGNAFSLSVADASCTRSWVSYRDMTLTLAADGRLTGTGTGEIYTQSGGHADFAAATMVFSGAPDVDTPWFRVENALPSVKLNDPIEPFVGVTLRASEPLPPSTRPVLTSTGGDHLVLAPPSPSGSPRENAALTWFPPPPVLLRYADEYVVRPEGVVDFAGNLDTATPRFQTRAAPPLAAQDGFESVTDATLGGATVISGAGFPVIAGQKSLYVPPHDNTSLEDHEARSLLALRLAVPAGATMIRFSFRAVGYPAAGHGGSRRFAYASVGQAITSGGLAAPETGTPFEMPDHAMVTLGPVTPAEFPLAAGGGPEVVLAYIDDGSYECGILLTVPGVIIDDLRVE